MNHNRAVLALALSTAVLVTPAAAQAKTTTETAADGAVKASFRYTANKDRTQYKNLLVEIERGGALLLRTTLPGYRGFWPGGAVDKSSVDVRDLDADGEPEAVIKLYSGGAHCCVVNLIYRYRAQTNSYSLLRANFAYRLRNLDKKGAPELVTADLRLSEAFGTVYAESRVPIRIFRLEKGRLVDVTRSFPKLVGKDLAELRKDYPRYKRQKANLRGILAAIVADKLLLNDRAGATATFERIKMRYGNEFTHQLKRFLARRGYSLRPR